MSDFGKDCTNCRACVDACPFLKEFGTSLKIVEEKPAAVFYGTSCLCCKTGRASKKLPAAAFFKTKERLFRRHQFPVS